MDLVGDGFGQRALQFEHDSRETHPPLRQRASAEDCIALAGQVITLNE